MAYNFPDSPSNGDTVTINGIVYTYNSTKGAWKTTAASGGSGGASVTSSDTAPTSPSDGDLWWSSSEAVLYIYYADSDSSQWVQATTPGADGASGLNVTTSDTAPTSPSAGDFWWDSDANALFIYYTDADSSQWVQATTPGADGADGVDGTNGVDGADGSAAVYTNATDLPTSNNSTGDLAFVTSTNRLYIWNGSGWYNIALINTTPTISGVSSSYALAIDGTPTTVTITATDPEGIPITYSIASDTSGNIATVAQGTGASSNVFTITPSTNSGNAGTFSLTFRASDGVNIASSIASFTLQFSVTNQNYTTALITSTGSNGATNGTFVDSSSTNKTVTNLNASQTSFSPYRHGGYSHYYTASLNEYHTATISAIGTSWTIEGWFYRTGGVSSGLQVAGHIGAINATNGCSWGIEDTQIVFRANGTTDSAFSVSSTTNRWIHLAFDYDGTTLTCYVNGVSIGTASRTLNITETLLNIGYYNTSFTYEGYIKDMRISTTRRYTSAFTAPTEAYDTDNDTDILVRNQPFIRDVSSNSRTVTASGSNGTHTQHPFSPYDTKEYAVADHGGSYSLVSRSGQTGPSIDVASDPDFAFGTAPFTIEFWYYPNQAGQQWDILISMPGNDGIFFGNRSGYLDWTNNNDTAALIRSSWPAIGQWSHIVLTQDSTTRAVFINGVRTGTASTAHSWAQGQLRVSYGAGRGNFSNIRIVKGTAVYDPSQTTLTIPTAPLTDITNTKLLLKGENGGIIDKAQVAKEIRLISVTSSTTQSKYLTSSIYIGGAGKYIDLVNAPLYNFGTGDFTVEAWIYNNGGGTGTFLTGTTVGDMDIAFDSSGLRLGRYSTAWDATQSYTFTSVWTHYAISRSSGTVRFFIDGTQQGSDVSNSINYTIAGTPRIGVAGNGSDRPTTAYISDLRVTKGLARYTANFTPPASELEG